MERLLNYYTIYATSGAIFKKKYFLKLWKNHSNKVDEGLQLNNAVRYIGSKKKQQYFGFTNEELMKTGFLSSASNQGKKYENVKLDLFAFNKIINEIGGRLEYVKSGTTGHTFKGVSYLDPSDKEK